MEVGGGGQQWLTCLLQVADADGVHGEESRRGTVLRAHVGNGGPVGDGQLGHTRPKELHKLAHHAHLPQVLQSQEGQEVSLVSPFPPPPTRPPDAAVTLVTVRTMSVEVMNLSGSPLSL